MSGLPLLAVAAALCAMTRRAEASCPIALDGDAAVVDRVRAELGSFGDSAPPCVALWVQCRQNGAQLEIDLHDELGRSSLHLFASADGAAAFLVSWSRRPLVDLDASAPPGLVVPRPPRPLPDPVATTDARDQVWHLEISLDYIAATGISSQWGTLSAAVMKRSQIWRYGGDVRALTGTFLGNLTMEADAVFGVETALAPRVAASAELVVGDAVLARGSEDIFGPDYGTDGLRAGLRGGVVWQMYDPIGLELQWGYDVLRSPLGGLARLSHIALGLRWLP
ncbi:MAG TPA: hypothetical protein VHW23_17350 [Kofleriaceae bacterium]|jgi:hypothetical protein|nr:hypothetical protein [Kofleriaceae bacterium]